MDGWRDEADEGHSESLRGVSETDLLAWRLSFSLMLRRRDVKVEEGVEAGAREVWLVEGWVVAAEGCRNAEGGLKSS